MAPQRRSAGFSFTEVLIGAVVLGLVIVSATRSLTASVSAKQALVDEPTQAFTLAREIHALALSLPDEVDDGLPVLSPEDVALLEDIDGASFSPPVDSELSELSSLSTWRQTVSMRPVSLADPSVDDPDSNLIELTVEVLDGGASMGTFRWWISP